MSCSTPCEVAKHTVSITNIMWLVTIILVAVIVAELCDRWRAPWWWQGVGVAWALVTVMVLVWEWGFLCGNFLCVAPDICSYGLSQGWKIPCW